jgi:SSS family solute:Na+ symporter
LNLHLVLLVAYSLALVLLGLWLGRMVRVPGDFFVAGRRLGAPLLGATVLAANIGAGSTIGATSLGYRHGLSAWWWNGSAAIGTLALALWVGPRIWRVARDRNLYTVGDWLDQRFGHPVRVVVSALLWVATLFILAGQLVGGAAILEVVVGLPKYAGCLVGGVVMTVYFMAGGLLGSAWINAVQLVVIFAGFGLAVPALLAAAGGWTAIATAPSAPPGFLDPAFTAGPGTGWTLLFLLGPAFVSSPGLVQKAYGGRDVRAVVAGIGASAIVLLVFALAPPLLGMAARVRYPPLDSPDLALPTILAGGLPVALGSLGLAAVFSAEVSSADAVLFLLATSLSQDLYRGFLHPAATEAQVLRAARLAAAAGGAAGVAIAVVMAPTVIQALSIFYTVLGVVLFVPIVAGLYTSRGGVPEALASIAAGLIGLVVTRIATAGSGFGPLLPPNAVGILAAALAYFLVTVLRERPARLRGRARTIGRGGVR